MDYLKTGVWFVFVKHQQQLPLLPGVTNKMSEDNAEIKTDAEGYNEEDLDVDNLDIKFSDKASFRDKSSHFQQVLHKSSKYRKGTGIPEPKGYKHGTLEGMSSRPNMPDATSEENGEIDMISTPRRGQAPKVQPRTLSRAQANIYLSTKGDDNTKGLNSGPRVVHQEEISNMIGSPRLDIRKAGTQRTISLPPVSGNDKNKMNDITSYSRPPDEISARLKLASAESRSAPNSPRSGSTPVSAKRNREFDNRISMDIHTLASPRGAPTQRLNPLSK